MKCRYVFEFPSTHFCASALIREFQEFDGEYMASYHDRNALGFLHVLEQAGVETHVYFPTVPARHTRFLASSSTVEEVWAG